MEASQREVSFHEKLGIITCTCTTMTDEMDPPHCWCGEEKMDRMKFANAAFLSGSTGPNSVYSVPVYLHCTAQHTQDAA